MIAIELLGMFEVAAMVGLILLLLKPVITCDNGNRYSGYWFDPECKVVDRLKNIE